MTEKVPSKTLTVKLGENERELFMSYGLLDKLVRQVRDLDQITEVYVNPDIRNAILEEVLADRNRTGKITTRYSVEDLELDLETVDDVLAWAVEHITGFFVRSLTLMNERINSRQVNELAEKVQTSMSNGSAT